MSLLHLPELVVNRTACVLIAAKYEKRQVDFERQVSPYVIRLIRPPTIPWRESICGEQHNPGF